MQLLPMINRTLLTAIVVLGVSGHCVRADSTHWIWGQRGTSGFETQQSFDLSSVPKRAQLKCAVDFCTATVQINQKFAFRLDGTNSLRVLDTTSWLKSGANRIRITAESVSGPAALAYELRMTTDNGQILVVRSSKGGAEGLHERRPKHRSFGEITHEPWWDLTRSPSVSVFDEYNQWEEALAGSAEEEIASFQLADGFQIELLYSAQPQHGSWVSMELDDQGRILLGREDVGVLRLTLSDDRSVEPVVETLNDTIKGVQGLLLTDQGLIASANRSKALYRLNPSGNRPLGSVTLLQETAGGPGDHGRHDAVQDSVGRVYVIHGDSVQIPDRFTSLVPATNEFIEGKPEDGHVIQTDVAGSQWKVYCCGLRNPYGIAINNSGDLFTYDADAERHTGLPWYRPTRIVHLMPGVDYGWRNPENPWPGYLPDMMPAIAKIGRGSPTSLKFGYASHFPPAYRNALFALDWSYGRILAIHLVPQGSTYAAHAEVFARGRPFSVCDLDFAADGSMYVVTGGRDTKSRLYRIRHVAKKTKTRTESRQIIDRLNYSARMRRHRRDLETLFDRPGSDAIAAAWTSLSHPDRGVRSAARILLEQQPIGKWQDRVWNEQKPATALPALLALARVGPPRLLQQVHRKLHSLQLAETWHLPYAIRIESLVDESVEDNDSRSRAICDLFEPHFPTGRRTIDRELCRLLVDHDSSIVVERTLEILANEKDQIDHFHYLVCLADARRGWDTDRHHEFFRLLGGARLFITDEGLNDRLDRLFEKAIEQVAQTNRPIYRELFVVKADTRLPQQQLPYLTKWTVAEIMRQLKGLPKETADPDRGAHVFATASCDRCHRFGSTGRAFGPDLTTVASRFGREHIVQQIVEPSQTISSQYRSYNIALNDGKVISGQVVYNGFRKSILRVATDPLSLHDTVEIRKSQIESFQASDLSPMPERLLDTLTIEQIADLLAYLGCAVN